MDPKLGLNPKSGVKETQEITLVQSPSWIRSTWFPFKCSILKPELKTCVWLRACAMWLHYILTVFKEARQKKLLDYEKWPHWKQRENGDGFIIRFIIGCPSRARSIAQLWGMWLIKASAGQPAASKCHGPVMSEFITLTGAICCLINL